ncbi:MAG: hypothetical protein IIY14_05010 [Bacteroidales bacterium]|jgi:hypothetical protein|nr:hypothetical protein [Bacteroidales bacterium]MBQ5881942.1 hypothetical protein [Bacteroidales bacterium]
MKQFLNLLIIGLVLLSSCTKPDNNTPKEDDENNNTEAFTIETSQISGLSAVIDIKPQDKNTKYFYWLYEMDRYINEFQESDELIIENDIAYWQYVEDITGDSWLEHMQNDLVSGDITINSSDFYNLLLWDTEYIAYAYGLDSLGNVTTPVSKHTFSTLAPEKENTTFDIEISSIEWDDTYKKYAVEATITPSNPDTRFFTTITNMDWYEWYFSEYNEGRSDEDFIMYEILLNTSRPSYEILEEMCLTGASVYSPAQMRNQYFTPNKRYGVFVFGMSEDGPTTSLTVYEFTTPS